MELAGFRGWKRPKMPRIYNEIELEFFCSKCGNYMTRNVSKIQYTDYEFYIEACKICLKEAKEDAYDEGYKEAIDIESRAGD